MDIREHDVVITKDGTQATVIFILKAGEAYMGEIYSPEGPETFYEITIKHEDVDQVIYRA